jgi:hypothetical protein
MVAQLILAIKHLTTVGAGVERSIVLLHMAAVLFATTERIDATIGTLEMAMNMSLKTMVAGGLDSECGAILRLILRPVLNRGRVDGMNGHASLWYVKVVVFVTDAISDVQRYVWSMDSHVGVHLSIQQGSSIFHQGGAACGGVGVVLSVVPYTVGMWTEASPPHSMPLFRTRSARFGQQGYKKKLTPGQPRQPWKYLPEKSDRVPYRSEARKLNMKTCQEPVRGAWNAGTVGSVAQVGE